jgi:hypothetical protein
MKAEAGVSTKAGLRCEQREIVGGRERCHHPKRSQDHPLFATPSRGKRSGPGRDSRRRSSEFSPATWVALTAAALWAPSMCAHAFSMGAHALSIASRQPSRAAPGWGSMQTGRAQCCEVRQTAAIACRTRTHQLLTHCMLSCSTRARTHTHTHTHTHAHACMHACAHACTHAHKPKRHTEQVKMAALPPRLGARGVGGGEALASSRQQRGGPRQQPPTADRAGADFIENYYLHKILLFT